jgi:Flp pilus assembly CpaE family ATPase
VVCGHSEGDDGTVWYYSSPAQLDELLQVLISTTYPPEMKLLAAINEMRNVINAHMNITLELVERFRGSRKSAISLHDGQFVDIF